MYLLPYPQPNVKDGSNVFKFHINVSMLADKYDCPSLRNAAVAKFHRSANVFHKYWQIQDTLDNLISAIAELCGPDAQQAADLYLRNEALSFCAANHGRIFINVEFQKKVQDSSLFDGEAMAKLLSEVGELALKKENSRVPAHYPIFGQHLNYPSHGAPAVP
jgi:D-hexose-6-phosphate mutarotase